MGHREGALVGFLTVFFLGVAVALLLASHTRGVGHDTQGALTFHPLAIPDATERVTKRPPSPGGGPGLDLPAATWVDTQHAKPAIVPAEPARVDSGRVRAHVVSVTAVAVAKPPVHHVAKAPVSPVAKRPAHALTGKATYYAYVVGGAAAGPALRNALGTHWRGTVVTVSANGSSVRVQLSDWCQCLRGTADERIIDLDSRSFAVLASLSRGKVIVTVRW